MAPLRKQLQLTLTETAKGGRGFPLPFLQYIRDCNEGDCAGNTEQRRKQYAEVIERDSDIKKAHEQKGSYSEKAAYRKPSEIF